jgi:peptidoglycan biosynthesis protein MviN/MurJ (putative lipid II flippase)
VEFRRLAVSLMAGGLLGKFAGVARKLSLAAVYGTGDVVAALRIAQAAALLPVHLVTSDALNAAFLPLHQRHDDAEAARTLYRATHLALVGAVTLVSAVLLVAAGPVVAVLAPGLDAATLDTAATMVRVLAIGLPFYASGVTRSYLALALGHPQLVSLRATIVNLGMLGGIVAAAALRSWVWLPAGFTGGSVVYATWTYAVVARRGMHPPRPRWMGREAYLAALRPLARVLRGLLVLPLVVQANEVAERVVASLLGEGVVAATEYANFVADSIVTFLAVPLGLAGLASIGVGDDVRSRARDRIASVAAPVLAITVPMSVVLALRSDDVVALIYARGAFDQASVDATAAVMTGFAIGLWAQVLGYIGVRTFSGTLQTGFLVRCQAISFAAGIAVLTLAVPTRSPVFIGLSGSVYGVTSLLLVCRRVSATSVVSRWILLMAPGACLLAGLDRLLAPVLDGRPLAACAVLTALWAVYCLSVPRLRTEVLRVIGPRALRRR